MIILFLYLFDCSLYFCLFDRENVSHFLHNDALTQIVYYRTDYFKRLRRRRALGKYFTCYAILIDCLIASNSENNSLYLSICSTGHNPRHFTILICRIRTNLILYCMACSTTCRKFYAGCSTTFLKRTLR